MIHRQLLQNLQAWKSNVNRKPLVLRGARQVGKTTLVHLFSKQFEQYIYINLEKKEDQESFLSYTNTQELIQTLCLLKNKQAYTQKKTLLFIDEIQEMPEMMNQLRYFYEDTPALYVIAAGSLLEMVLTQKIKFPVGRVVFMQVRPFSFIEFLNAIGEQQLVKALENIPIQKSIHARVLHLFHEYALIGGMPEIVMEYALHKDVVQLADTYDSLLLSYIDDIEKYAKNTTQTHVLRHLIQTFLQQAGTRISFGNFGNSNYGAREVGEAMRVLEKNQLLQLTYPTAGTQLPIDIITKRKPRLQVLDTGLINYFSKIQHLIIGAKDLTATYNGKIIEHLVGQELLALRSSPNHRLSFWVQENANANAEIDYVYPFEGKLIPIEVKSGKTGTLKSLHIYMSKTIHSIAVRFYAGPIQIDEINTKNGHSHLLSLPYYLVHKIDDYLSWFIQKLG